MTIQTLYKNISLAEHSKFDSFDLISVMPYLPEYNQYKFIPLLHKNKEKLKAGKYFNHSIGCADDIAYFGTIDCQRNVEFIALGINNTIKSAIMQASSNPVTRKVKYIVISSTCLGLRYENPNIIVFENEHVDCNPDWIIEYRIENYIK